MRRREFLGVLGGAAAAWPLAAQAQQHAGKLPTIGFLGAATASGWSSWVTTFEKRLRELGWVDGRTIAIEYRWADGRSDRSAEVAAEFVRLKVDIVVTGGIAVPALKPFTKKCAAWMRHGSAKALKTAKTCGPTNLKTTRHAVTPTSDGICASRFSRRKKPV